MKFNLIETVKGLSAGIYNTIFLDEQVEEIAKERLSICANCPFDSEVKRASGIKIRRPDHFCTDCSCDLTLKSRAMNQKCPQGKWDAVTDDEMGFTIQELLKKKDEQDK